MTLKLEKTIIKPEAPIRLDKALAAAFPQYPRRQLRRWIEQGSVWVNAKRVRRQGMLLQPSQTYAVTLYPVDLTSALNYLSTFPWHQHILYQDTAIIAVNKPAGINAYPTQYAVSDSLFVYLQQQGLLPKTARPFHRLDRPVSGVMVIPLTRTAAAHLNQQLAQQHIAKYYIAVISGVPDKDQWEVSGYLKPPTSTQPVAQFFPEARSGTKFSRTRFRVLWKENTLNRAVVLAIPVTGRTHQIRLHLQISGYPVLNDTRYGGPALDLPSFPPVILLHHTAMRFTHPITKQMLTIEAPLPDHFRPWIPETLSISFPEKD